MIDSVSVPQGFGAVPSPSKKAARFFLPLNEKDGKRVAEFLRGADSKEEKNRLIGKPEKGTAELV